MEKIELILVVVFTILLPDSVLGTEDRKKIKGHYFKGIKAWYEACRDGAGITIVL